MKRCERLTLLTDSLGIDEESFFNFIEWTLDELLVSHLVQAEEFSKIRVRLGNSRLKEFGDLLNSQTKREWTHEQTKKIYSMCLEKASRKQYRKPISTGDFLKLLWTSDLYCKKCGKKPPEVKLHIDHIFPSSMGGSSKASNLQFLCARCNLEKSNKVEGGTPWLDLA